jgi:phosphoserine phosphatase RsbX
MVADAIGPGELIDWAVASRALPGEARSGDLHVVEPFADGVLVGVVDGLGHGDEAADAAEAAVGTLIDHAHEAPVSLVRQCHERLIGTRGVAMSVASITGRDQSMQWLGVGNVEASLFRCRPATAPARESLILRGGVVGYRLPFLRSSVVAVGRDDLLVLATDGIQSYSFDALRATAPPARIAQDILARFARDTDGALVVVARYVGEPS